MENATHAETGNGDLHDHEHFRQMQLTTNDKSSPPALALEVEQITSKTAVADGICE